MGEGPIAGLPTNGASPSTSVENPVNHAKAHAREIVWLGWVRPFKRSRQLATVAHDSAKFWQPLTLDGNEGVEMREVYAVKGWRSGVQSADITPDGSHLVIIGIDSIVNIISFDHGERPQLRTFEMGYMDVWFVRILTAPSSYSHTYATVSFSDQIFKFNDKGEVMQKEPFPNSRRTSAFALSPLGDKLAVANYEGTVKIVLADDLKSVDTINVHSMRIRCVIFTNEGTQILTGSEDKTVKLWSIVDVPEKAQTRGLVRRYCGHRTAVSSLALDPQPESDRLASASMSGELIVWSLAKASMTFVLRETHTGMISTLSWTLCGRWLATGGDDTAIRVWRIPGGNEDHLDEDEPEEVVEDDWRGLTQTQPANGTDLGDDDDDDNGDHDVDQSLDIPDENLPPYEANPRFFASQGENPTQTQMASDENDAEIPGGDDDHNTMDADEYEQQGYSPTNVYNPGDEQHHEASVEGNQEQMEHDNEPIDDNQSYAPEPSWTATQTQRLEIDDDDENSQNHTN